MKPSNAEIRNQITNQLIEAIEKGTLPWRRQFTPDPNSGLATSLSSGKKYNGINQILFQMSGDYKSKSACFSTVPDSLTISTSSK